MAVTKEPFGFKGDAPVYKYTVSNGSGTRFSVMTLGATLTNVFVKDKRGTEADVITGFDSAEDYLVAEGYSGSVAGRVCNRIRNARFTLDGREYLLYANDGKHQLHGGNEGFSFKLWDAVSADGPEPSVTLTYLSPDGEENYPGNLTATVTYKLTETGAVSVEFGGETDMETVVSLTQHAYYNMGGYTSGPVYDHTLWVDTDRITEIDGELIPTGVLAPVTGTAFDLTEPVRVGDVIASDEPVIRELGGLDNNFMLTAPDGTMRHVATFADPASGRYVDVITDRPCIQIYTANMINTEDVPFKGGVRQYKHCAVCLETQMMPDSVNHPEIMSVVLRPGERYSARTVYQFGCK